MIPGNYEASWNRSNFETVTITADSPDEIVFRLVAPRTVTGSVVDAVIGTPIEGAFVATSHSTSDRGVSSLQDEQWKVHERQKAGAVEDAALDILRPIYGREVRMTRSDADGTFSITESTPKPESSTR